MPRTLSATFESNTQKPVTEPTWLLHLKFSIPVLVSSGAVITHDSLEFNRQGLRVEKMDSRSLRVVLRDDDNLIKAIIDTDGIDDIAVALWAYYETDGVKVWSGFTDGVRFVRHEAQLNATRIQAGSATYPERFFNRGDFPYMPTDGKVIKWGTHEITLRSR